MFANKSRRRSKALSIMVVFSMLLSFFPVALSFPANVQAATTLTVYPAPAGVPLNGDFTAQVREPGGVWQDLDEYRTIVGSPSKSNASFVYFDTGGQVEMSVTYNAGTITSARIRGLNTEITPTINGNTMTFSMSGPMKLSVEVNGNVNRNLMVFANPLEVNPPSPTDPDVIYLGPGLYQQNYTVPSGKTLYIAGGAVIQGSVDLSNSTNAKVIGRGVLDRPSYVGIFADYSNQVTIDGVIVNGYGNGNNGGYSINLGNATNATVNNYKAFGVNKWGDGIDCFACKNVTINDVYIRSHDDSIAIYNDRGFGGKVFYGDSNNISVTNSILQPDLARPINIGTHGFPWAPGGGHTIEDLTFSNLDLWIHNQGHRIQFISGDGNLIQNVNFSDIRINDAVEGRFLLMDVKKHDYSVGRGINNVHFKNVSYTGSNASGNPINGNSSTRMIQNITFENLIINGTVITNAAQGNITPNGYTRNINFIASGDPVPAAPTQFPSPAPINLALNRPASASSSQGGNPVSNGNDGSASTRWSANDGNTGHWWTVDLGSSKNITRGTQVMWEQSGKAYQYKIETSNDNVNWTLQVDKTNNTSTDQIQNDPFYETARYVRMTVTGLETGAWASFYDFKVLGEAVNLAENKAASTDSTLSGFPVNWGVDGNSITRWSAADQAAGHWVKVDLGYVKNIAYGTQVSFEKSGVAYQYKIETSKDNTNWTLKVDKTNNTSTEQVQTDYFSDSARYVRITVTGVPSGANASFYDLKVFGDPVNLALGKYAFTDSADPANPAADGNDISTSTRWSAADGLTGHWWAVDLGSSEGITGTQVMWKKPDTYYQYRIETSDDNVNWTWRVDKGGNGNSAQVQSDSFAATARYVRITVTGVPSGDAASFYDFKVFGDTGDTVTMARLPFDETGGSIAYDATGNGWNGTLVGGANRVAGKYGNAVSFNGRNQFVELPSGVVASDNEITVTALVFLNSANNGTRIFDFGSGTDSYMYLTPNNADNGKLRFGITTSGNTHEQQIDGTAPLTTGVWHHVAVTLNGSTGTLYVDGQQAGSNTGMSIKPSDLGFTTQNWIGRSQYSSDPYLDGLVDDFRIYNTALPASEIIIAPNETVELTATQAMTYRVKATDSMGALLIYSADKLPSGAVFDAAAGVFSWTPTLMNYGDNEVTFSVSNGLREVSQTVDFKVNLNILPPDDYTKGSYYLYQQEVERIQAALAVPAADRGALAAQLVQAEGLLVRFPLSVYSFEGNASNTFGTTVGTVTGTESYTTGKFGQAINLNGTNSYVTLPAAHPMSAYNEITLATWVYWNGSTQWQRIFDFGNNTSQYLFLTPRSGSNTMRFEIKNGGSGQIVETSQLAANQWTHVAVTLGGGTAKLFVNGELKATKTGITIKPSDIKPSLNYIGKSQFADPLFNGMIDEFRIYNHALSAEEVQAVFNNTAKWIDNSLLTVLLDKVHKLLQDTDFVAEYYTPESYEAFQTALANAESVADHANTTQEEIDAAATSLMEAIEGLEYIEGLPVLVPIGDKFVIAEQQLAFTVEEMNGMDGIEFGVEDLPQGASFNPETRTFKWTPGKEQGGVHKVVFTVKSGALSTSKTVKITVKGLPVITAEPVVEVTAKKLLTYQVRASDPSNVKLTYSVKNLPANASFDAAAGLLSWTPGQADYGSHPMIFTVSNGSFEASQTVNFNVKLNVIPPKGYTQGSYYLYLKKVVRIEAEMAKLDADKAQLAAELVQAEDSLVQVPLSLYSFEGNVANAFGKFDGSASGNLVYSEGKIGQAVNLNGTDGYMTLPSEHTLASYNEITLATWVNWKGGNQWQRIFDFGNNTSQYLFLTPRSGSNTLRFAIKNGGGEQMVETSQLAANQWAHVAVTLGGGTAKLYVNGELKATKTGFTIKPSDFKPSKNYIGKSQWPDPLYNGMIDEFRIYDHALTDDEIKAVYNNTAEWIDKTLIPVLLEEAGGIDTDLYTEESVQALQAEVTNSQAVYGNATATQAEIDAASDELLAALKGLQWKDITASVDPAEPSGKNGWYSSPVTVTLSPAKIAEYSLDGGVTWTAYSAPITLNQEGTHQVLYRRTVDAGEAKSLEFKIDLTAPAAQITGAASYTIDQDVLITCTATDDISGVSGSPCDKPLLQVKAYSLESGQHTVSVTAEDMAGNQTTVAHTFTVTVTFDSLKTVTNAFLQATGTKAWDTVAKSLDQKLDQAKAAAGSGKIDAAKSMMADYINQVTDQSGKFFTQAQADILIRWAQIVI